MRAVVVELLVVRGEDVDVCKLMVLMAVVVVVVFEAVVFEAVVVTEDPPRPPDRSDVVRVPL